MQRNRVNLLPLLGLLVLQMDHKVLKVHKGKLDLRVLKVHKV